MEQESSVRKNIREAQERREQGEGLWIKREAQFFNEEWVRNLFGKNDLDKATERDKERPKSDQDEIKTEKRIQGSCE